MKEIISRTLRGARTDPVPTTGSDTVSGVGKREALMSEAVAEVGWPAEWPERSMSGLVLRSGFVLGFGALLLWTGIASIGRDDAGSVIGSVLVLAGVAIVGNAVIGIVAATAHRPRRLTVARGRSERFDQDGVAVPGARGVAVASVVATGAVALTAAALLLAPGPAWIVACVGLLGAAWPVAAAVRRLRGAEALVVVPAGIEYRSPSGSVAVDWGTVVSVVARAPYRGRLVGVVTSGSAVRRRGTDGPWSAAEFPVWSGGLPLPVDRLDADPLLVLDLLSRAHTDPALRARLGSDADPMSVVG